MRKKLTILEATALMLATMLALCGVAQAAPVGGKADAKCQQLAIKTLGPGFNPADYTFVGGTEGNDESVGSGVASPEVFCGFGGNDSIGTLDAGDIFLGGDGSDSVTINNATFYGGAGNDRVNNNGFVGTFYGEAGNDIVDGTNEGTFVQ